MKLNKNHLLNKLGDQVESHLHIAISSFQNESEKVLLCPSATGGWSIAQCLDHLNSYGDYFLPRLSKVLQVETSDNAVTFKSGWLGDYFSKMMEPSAKKYKAAKGHTPRKDLDVYKVTATFIAQQEELLLLLRRATSANLNHRIPISISPIIRLKAGDVFRFLIAHNERHMQQALRNLP
ncbi:DinB family protein [Desertivirga brevis]|uniref:DinB family protein n=1 Tax=Desertivirga brevis TaxID=2810310 RepID=UPI001A971277|nr:DinB family protein [Pedobacter sp. SYSU D00873]